LNTFNFRFRRKQYSEASKAVVLPADHYKKEAVFVLSGAKRLVVVVGSRSQLRDPIRWRSFYQVIL